MGVIEIEHPGRSTVEAALLVSAYAIGLALVATETFRRRDVA